MKSVEKELRDVVHMLAGKAANDDINVSDYLQVFGAYIQVTRESDSQRKLQDMAKQITDLQATVTALQLRGAPANSTTVMPRGI